jgi:Holliday junction DNA helicase RuvB
MDAKERVSLLRALSQNPDWKDTLTEALKLHKENDGKSWLGFEWYEVHTAPQILNMMVAARILDITFSSHSSTHYMVRDPDTVAQALTALEGPVDSDEEVEIPANLFDVIVGHDKVKKVFNLSLASPRPVHILLVGPVATAKSLFLSELARLAGARFALGSTSSRAGIAEYLLLEKPRYLILDEIDKMDMKDLSVLLTLMESGTVSRLKKRMTEEEQLTCWVFAGANSVAKLPTELKSRFLVLRLLAYSDSEFREVSRAVLTKREGTSGPLSDYVIEQVLAHSRDVRDCVKIARLAATREDVDELVRLMWPAG